MNVRRAGWIILFTAVLVAAYQPASSANVEGEGESVELIAGHFIGARKNILYTTFVDFIEKLNESGKGLVKVTRIVGPDSISRRQWCNAVRSGLVDIVALGFSYCNNLVPVAEGLNAQQFTPAELRRNGTYAFLRQLFARDANAYFLGQYSWGTRFHIFTRESVGSLAELRSLRLRQTVTLRNIYDRLGIDGHAMEIGAIYTAMERGVIDGYVIPSNVVRPRRLHEVTGYRIDPGILNSALMVLVNLDSWNSMSPAQQGFLEGMGLLLESDIDPRLRAQNAEMENALFSEHGLQRVELEAADAARLDDTANRAIWDEIDRNAPGDGPRLRALITR